MKRKINKVGPNTLTVSLPSSWVKKYAIKPGTEIEMEENGPVLEIFSKKGISLGEKRIKISKASYSYLKSIITHAYRKGYNRIILEFDDEEILFEIQKIVDSLMGNEIISRNKTHCEIINVSKELEEEFDSLVKNSFIMLMENSKDTLEDLSKSKLTGYESLSSKNLIITKYTDFCKRILNKHARNDINVIYQYQIIWNLEKISNEYKYIYRYCVENGIKKPSKELLSYLEETNKLLLLYYQAYYEKNMNKLKELANKKDDLLYGTFYPLLKKLPKDELGAIHHMSIIIRRLWDMSGPLIGMNF